MTEELSILKTDTRQRVRTPASQREALLDAFERTSMSGAQFARHHGIRYPTFANWCQKRRRSGGLERGSPRDSTPQSSQSSHWVEGVLSEAHQAQSPPPPSARPLSVALPGGALLHLDSMAQVPLAAALLRAMQSTLAPASSPSLTC